jgi:hypothetical protein
MYKKVLVATVIVLASAVLTLRGTGEVHAAEKKGTSKAKTAQKEEPQKTFDAHETGVRYHFEDTDMDFNFGTLVLGSTVNHGVEIGEAFTTAAKIKDGDAASW